MPEGEITLRLPRAMRSAIPHNNLLKEKNSDHSDSVIRKESGGSAPNSPYQKVKVADDKENKDYK